MILRIETVTLIDMIVHKLKTNSSGILTLYTVLNIMTGK